MKVYEIKNILQCRVLTQDIDLDFDVETVLASDGMSEILAFYVPGALMLTGLSNIQSVRTAIVADVRVIVYIRGKRPDERTVELARQKNIPILVTDLGMFDVCGILHSRGLKGTM